MSRFVLLTTLATAFSVLGSLTSLPAQTDPAAAPAVESKPLVLPLVYRSPQQRVLLAMASPPETEAAKKALREHKLKFDHRDWIDTAQKDYSSYHLIVGGSNCMDIWPNSNAKEPAAFEPLEKFVAEGGHLLLFGTYNGRNCEHLARFGISTGIYHDYAGYRTVPGRTEVLFKGMEKIVPANNKLSSAGNFVVTQPHVMFLQRSEKAAGPDQPALATLAYKKGRVTYTQVEPDYQNDLWLITVLLNWALKGGPTVEDQLDQNVVLDERGIAQQRKIAVPSDADLKAVEESIRQTLRDDFANAMTPEDKAKLADRLVEMSRMESRPAFAFVCLSLAKDIHLESASPANVFAILRRLGAQFRIDEADANLKAARKLGESVRDPAGSAELAKECLDLADELAVAERFSDATECAGLAKSAAQAAKHRHYQSLILPLTKRLTLLATETERVKPFRERLIKDKDDWEAREAMCKFHCLILRDWEYGLSLMKDDQHRFWKDPAWQHLSQMEQKVPTDPNVLEIYGEGWLAVANKVTVGMRPAVQARARAWYWKALSKSSGTQRAAIEKKMSRIPTTKFDLRVSLKIGGPSTMRISRNAIVWEQETGTRPENVQVNNQAWNVDAQPVLKNLGSTRYFPEEVCLETATLVPVRMRGTAKLTSVSPEELAIELNGDDEGEFIIKFGP